MGVRLNKYIADCTGISRRAADQLIVDGLVKVNNKPAVLGQTVDPEKDKVFTQGQTLRPQRKEYVLLYKPPGYLTTRSDPEGRRTVYDLLPTQYHHLDPVGRLDADSSGVLLFSNDGEFVNQLSHPRYAHSRTYRVQLNKKLTQQVLSALEKGVMLEPEGKLAQCTVSSILDESTVVLTLKTGLNRQIRRTFEALGYDVKTLKRTAFSGITLGRLQPGSYRPLKPGEIRSLTPAPAKYPKSRAKSPQSPTSGPAGPGPAKKTYGPPSKNPNAPKRSPRGPGARKSRSAP